ncbi:ferritin-like domain-containing protein [Curvibacter sp. HBC61]|uniref:Ferritin-like domain-containing protein n=1 Tax=Curvibacter cyanobacteriorum TaxID=3026422 RepID=A0ABT5MUC1_9BURK|nr:ferritin-like domain-containing protein [Curvibacter sp. HBC61]MDD0836964.1 ferritin-like domain-containing protein [Curvibacter sp. HBC61]
MELRQRALQVLCLTDPAQKAAATVELHTQFEQLTLDTERGPVLPPGQCLPGHPERPPLVKHTSVVKRSPSTLEGRAALLHSIAHIEFNAINLALDAVWRFDGLPRDYYADWLRVAREEAYHFTLLREHLQRMPHLGQPWDYGDFPAHQGLWSMCERTAGDVLARMALVPRTLEARGLDATPLIQAKLRQIGSPDALEAVAVLDIILRDEVGHVAIGNHWYRWLCERAGLDPTAHYPVLTQRYEAPRMKPPFNENARRRAGFTEVEMAWLKNG